MKNELLFSPKLLLLTGVVHEDVDRLPSERVQGGPDAFGGELRGGNVSGKGRGLPGSAGRVVDLGGDAFGLPSVQVSDEHAGAVGREQAGRRGAEALAGSGDNGDLIRFGRRRGGSGLRSRNIVD